MPWRPHGRAKVNKKSPQAFGVCDRCYMLYNLVDLRWQFEFRGNQLQNIQLRVCDRCMDKPQDQLRPKNVPADPIPVYQPRPENYASDNQGVSSAALTNPDALFVEP
jgi:hypothetical protein